jgi:dihydrofolate reductase
MGRVVVTEFVSLDGVMEAPGGEPGYAHAGWVARVPDGGQFAYKLEEILEAEVHLLGRITYESFADAWPERTDEAGFAAKMNAMPKYVVSSTLRNLEWNNSHLLEGDVIAAVRALKERIDGVILIAGSRTLAQPLLVQGLVDELRMMVFPVVLGSGARLLPDSPDRIELELVETRSWDSGVVLVVYRPAATGGG